MVFCHVNSNWADDVEGFSPGRFLYCLCASTLVRCSRGVDEEEAHPFQESLSDLFSVAFWRIQWEATRQSLVPIP